RRYSVHAHIQNPVAAPKTHRGILPKVAARSECWGHWRDNGLYNDLYSWRLLPPRLFQSGGGSHGISDHSAVVLVWSCFDPPPVCRALSGFLRDHGPFGAFAAQDRLPECHPDRRGKRGIRRIAPSYRDKLRVGCSAHSADKTCCHALRAREAPVMM